MANEKEPTYGNGKICYVELPATDIGKSAKFYANVFGWNIRKGSDGVVSFDDSVGEVSGRWRLDRLPAGENTLLIHIMVADIQKTIAAVIQNGGKIVRPVGMDPPEITAWFRDPAGNVLGIYQQPGLKQ
jgi:uncharacterized protein